MATKYEMPEEADEKLLGTLGKEVEMKTFKTNIPEVLVCDVDQEMVKIICLGDYTGGVGRKGVFIDDYLEVSPPVKTIQPALIGVDFRLKIIRWKESEDHEPVTIRLQFWEIAEQERFTTMTSLYFRNSQGALVFWGTGNPSSLDGVPKWMKDVKEACPGIPCVLITDNIPNEPLYGPGKIFNNELALKQFCKDHGFVGHFEITSRDWESGEKSVFGQAVNCLLDEILQNDEKKDNTWI